MPDAVDLLGDRRRRLAPRQVHVGVAGGHLERRRAEEPPKKICGRGSDGDELGVLDVECSPVKSPARPATLPHDVQELPAARIARRLVEVVAEAALLASSPPVTTLSSSRPPEMRWNVAAIWAASVGDIRPGRNATRNRSAR